MKTISDFSDKTKEAAKNAGFKVAFTTVNDKVKNNTEEVPEKELFMKKHMNALKLEFEQGYNGSFEEFCEKKYRERFI